MPSSLDLLLIPYNDTDTICVPQNIVDYVLPYAHPLPSESNHKAIIGSLIYQNAKVPILDIARLENADKQMNLPDISDGRYRIVILSAISEDSSCENYAMIASNAPQLVSVSEHNIEETNALVSEFFHSRVLLKNSSAEQFTYVPNIEILERILFSES
ncbi:MAG: hypothetical protein KGV50_01140 [Gammaproteobacteria bacterium]|nr:hypothetical protein [Gammaproteobacteria bacterium]